jgi:hypothetical protein
MYKPELNSINLSSPINQVCSECGIECNRVTCIKKYGAEPLKKCFDISTYHKGICDWCKKEKYITEVRDFFYPDFNLMKQ